MFVRRLCLTSRLCYSTHVRHFTFGRTLRSYQTQNYQTPSSWNVTPIIEDREISKLNFADEMNQSKTELCRDIVMKVISDQNIPPEGIVVLSEFLESTERLHRYSLQTLLNLFNILLKWEQYQQIIDIYEGIAPALQAVNYSQLFLFPVFAAYYHTKQYHEFLAILDTRNNEPIHPAVAHYLLKVQFAMGDRNGMKETFGSLTKVNLSAGAIAEMATAFPKEIDFYYEQAKEKGFLSNSLINKVIKYSSRHISEIIQDFTEVGFQPDPSVYTTILGETQEIERVDDIYNAVKDIMYIDLIMYGAILNAYIKAGEIGRAEEIHKTEVIPKFGYRDECVNIFIIHYVAAKEYEKAEQMFDNLTKSGNRILDLTYNVVCKMYKQRGMIDKVRMINMRAQLSSQLSLCGYNTYLHALTQQPKSAESFAEAEETIQEMRDSDITFDGYTYCTILHLYNRYNQYDKAEKIVEEIMINKIPLTEKILSVLLRHFAFNARVQPELAIGQARWVEQLQIESSSPQYYTSLLNVYREANSEEDFTRILKEMESRGLDKSVFVYSMIMRFHIQNDKRTLAIHYLIKIIDEFSNTKEISHSTVRYMSDVLRKYSPPSLFERRELARKVLKIMENLPEYTTPQLTNTITAVMLMLSSCRLFEESESMILSYLAIHKNSFPALVITAHLKSLKFWNVGDEGARGAIRIWYAIEKNGYPMQRTFFAPLIFLLRTESSSLQQLYAIAKRNNIVLHPLSLGILRDSFRVMGQSTLVDDVKMYASRHRLQLPTEGVFIPQVFMNNAK